MDIQVVAAAIFGFLAGALLMFLIFENVLLKKAVAQTEKPKYDGGQYTNSAKPNKNRADPEWQFSESKYMKANFGPDIDPDLHPFGEPEQNSGETTTVTSSGYTVNGKPATPEQEKVIKEAMGLADTAFETASTSFSQMSDAFKALSKIKPQ
ncbi:hypothetical protein H1O16_gp353 [Burkholderia phage BcepSaruman]|uniref:Uncharacterized protein n=1 Tax=Burkholderia phage BcepSaruman TaxID=2530032 RepID=A0A4D5ZDW1_9CAUD|nr:hypothetical protein H1O16_gp353 [Burkholderia phage BcepSaruman]QBX06766.1 hypothetical protein BcepSaruman_353 [Burkholderia phage BcepSaruman]